MEKINNTLIGEVLSKLNQLLRIREMELRLNNLKPGFIAKMISAEIEQDIKDIKEVIKKLEKFRLW